jgi:hypothetical protein
MASTDSIIQDIPEEFLCPITQELMANPLMSRTGFTFERSAIMEWIFEHNNTCPMTRQPLRACDLVHDRNLQARICAWCSANDMKDFCNEMPFKQDGIGHLDAASVPEDVFVSFAMPEIKSVNQKQHKTKRRPLSSALNFASRSMQFSSRTHR